MIHLGRESKLLFFESYGPALHSMYFFPLSNFARIPAKYLLKTGSYLSEYDRPGAWEVL